MTAVVDFKVSFRSLYSFVGTGFLARMPFNLLLRSELDEFIRSGWMGYVLQVGGWWESDGRLKPIRKSNLHEAYYQTRQELLEGLVRSGTLYRTLLLPKDFDAGAMLSAPSYFGRYWTDNQSVAHEYKPRRCYQAEHPMPQKGIVYVVRVDTVVTADIDWIATVGCRLTNPILNEVRLKPGTLKMATSISRAWGFDEELVAATPSVVGITPMAEGPGFVENLAALSAADRLYA